jgi:hypothetical protein
MTITYEELLKLDRYLYEENSSMAIVIGSLPGTFVSIEPSAESREALWNYVT